MPRYRVKLQETYIRSVEVEVELPHPVTDGAGVRALMGEAMAQLGKRSEGEAQPKPGELFCTGVSFPLGIQAIEEEG